MFKSLEAAEHFKRYNAACHAMQSAVALVMQHDDECAPKHLRVGVNSAMVEHSALVGLLIEKGVIDEEEFGKALADGMEREVESYRKRIKELGFGDVTLA